MGDWSENEILCFEQTIIASGLMELSTKFQRLMPLQTTDMTTTVKHQHNYASICMQTLDLFHVF
jgi:hypothetical protein